MKIVLLTMVMLLGIATAQADDAAYPYLIFETTDGTTAVAVSSLSVLTVGDGMLTAGDKTFSLINLKKMYFATSGDATGIETTKTAVDLSGEVEIFSLNGMMLGTFGSFSEAQSRLRSGVYVIKANGRTLKVTLK